MNKRHSMLFSVTAVAVLAATLFGSTYTQSNIAGSTLAASSNDSMTQKIHDMGGLKLVMPQAFAAVSCDNVEEGRNVVSQIFTQKVLNSQLWAERLTKP